MMLLGILVVWLITALGLAIVTALVPGIRARSAGDLLLAALILGLINAVIRPLLLILTLPLTVLTFGLFALLVNAFVLQLTAMLVPGFEVRDFASALLGAVLMMLLAVLAFVLVQWLLFDGVIWIQIQPL